MNLFFSARLSLYLSPHSRIMAGLYIHIPFCRTRCIYCDFYSTVGEELQGRYVDALLREWAMRRDELRGERVETVYIGGGTPSQLPPVLLHRLFDGLCREIDFAACTEVTFEANPDDMTAGYAAELATLPINRISMGVQSFSDDDLRFLRRRHTATQAIEAVARCREAGFSRINIDLIYGLPGQTPHSWQENLNRALSLDLPHISAYNLIYEEGTALDLLRRKGVVQECDEVLSERLFDMLVDTLIAAGYEQYEISNFALPGEYARHNTSYWTDVPYLGLGASAHSYDRVARRRNVASLHDYITRIENGVPTYETEQLDADTRYNDRVITELRTMWGLDLDAIAADFGEARRQYCLRMARRHIASGTLMRTANRLYITRRGLFVSDGIMTDLLYVEE